MFTFAPQADLFIVRPAGTSTPEQSRRITELINENHFCKNPSQIVSRFISKVKNSVTNASATILLPLRRTLQRL